MCAYFIYTPNLIKIDKKNCIEIESILTQMYTLFPMQSDNIEL